jgi:hypothetical protein
MTQLSLVGVGVGVGVLAGDGVVVGWAVASVFGGAAVDAALGDAELRGTAAF